MGERDVLPLTFPDGTRIVLSYPAELRLAGLGVQPDASLLSRGRAYDQYPLTFLYDAPGRVVAPHEVVVRAGSWTVATRVPDPNARADIAGSLSVHETADGFAVVEAASPHMLSHTFGEGGGVQLALGDGDPAPARVTSLDPLIELSPMHCGEWGVREINKSYGSTCLDGRIFVSMSGANAFVETVLHGLQIEEWQPAGH